MLEASFLSGHQNWCFRLEFLELFQDMAWGAGKVLPLHISSTGFWPVDKATSWFCTSCYGHCTNRSSGKQLFSFCLGDLWWERHPSHRCFSSLWLVLRQLLVLVQSPCLGNIGPCHQPRSTHFGMRCCSKVNVNILTGGDSDIVDNIGGMLSAFQSLLMPRLLYE